MVRNVILVIASLAVLVALFVGYLLLVGTPGAVRGPRASDAVPQRTPSTSQPLRVMGDTEVHGGGRIVFTRYDERTGRPMDKFSCQDWQPVSGSENEVHVTEPELAMVLPSGMIATVLADEGELSGDRIDSDRLRPQRGWLAGNVRIIIDRETRAERTPPDERPADLIRIFMPRLEFDLERGELRTTEHVRVECDDFEVAGSGLELVWSEADNRVETLTIQRGEEFVLYRTGGLFGPAAPGADEAAAEAATPSALAEASRPPRSGRRITTYECTLLGHVVAEQYGRNEQGEVRVVGGLRADRIQLLFDVGAGARRLLGPSPTTAPASGPASRPARDPGRRLVLRWNGPLHLGPATGPSGAARRLHFTAWGQPAILTRGTAGEMRCAKVEYHDETQRIWIDPLPGQLIDLRLGEKLSATAAGIYIDRQERIIKLTGNVLLRSARGPGAAARASTIRSAHYAEIHIASAARAAAAGTDPLGDFDELESATFVGDVRVDLGKQKLTAQQLHVRFRPEAEEQTLEQSLDTAVADGGVRLTGGGGTLTAVQLELAFATTEAGKLYPRRMHAVGAVELVRQRERTPNPVQWYWTRLRTLPGRAPQPAQIRGDEVMAQLAPPPEASSDLPELLIRSIEVAGRAEVTDPQNMVIARGTRVIAVFEGANELVTAQVTGTADAPGLVYAEPFAVRGGQIDLDRAAQTLRVDGPSRLSFKTRRSLQGQRRREPARIVVTCTRRLRVDGRGNEVKFEGDVQAASAGEQLQSDVLTLQLEDVPEIARSARRQSWTAVLGPLVPLAGIQPPAATKRTYGVGIGTLDERIRKEPKWLTADNALVRSESYVTGEEEPVLHASISTPRLKADLVARQIVAQPAQLLMIDRRESAGATTGRALGVPSALLGSGPSQTAIECQGRMTYTLGPEGPRRRDTAVFEDAVYFRHVSGEAILSPAGAKPVSPTDPALSEALVGRDASLECERLECWFTVDEQGNRPLRGGGLARAPLRLASFIASDGVYLRYEEGPQVRDVVAEWVAFDREQQLIQVRGDEAALARVYSSNQLSGESDIQTLQEAIIDLTDGTLRARELTGRMRRP